MIQVRTETPHLELLLCGMLQAGIVGEEIVDRPHLACAVHDNPHDHGAGLAPEGTSGPMGSGGVSHGKLTKLPISGTTTTRSCFFGDVGL